MGTILVAKSEEFNPTEGGVRIPELHLNFWRLPALRGNLYYIDLGMFLQNKSNRDFSSFQVGIPASGDEVRAECLVEHVGERYGLWRLV
jgi:hypothetical protein